ncbi:TIGR01777 family oxidoreductase [Naasia sp. SYSU D00057]|uniref:TIGR01777 family oxidoreductase n=1 Tax=Naasia sp. SYSU D00057 TaxID=2817380 RepID=UPI001FEFECBE|nr:TIGR01777 family oxidoreductase [Naasia sp. SYSU D00057]
MAAPKRVPVPSAKPARAAKPTPAARPTVAPGGRPTAPDKPAPKPAERRVLRKGEPLRVLISGASGMIGTEVRRQLEAQGHTVLKLVRRAPSGPNEFTWAPDAKILDFRVLETVDAVINLSGASLSRVPWTPGWKRQIRSSRINSTRALVEAMSMASRPPAVFLSASAVGIYGSRPGEELTEESPRGEGFLADVVADWEAAALLGPDVTRTVLLRTGVVLGPHGALSPLRLLTRVGGGGPIGSGQQYWPWIGLHDEAAAIVHLLTSTLSGPVNLVGPQPATMEQLGRRLAKDLRRPFAIRAPEPILKLALQDAAGELLLADQKVLAGKLLADGFTFRDATSDAGIDAYAR